jgi:hypothetical protein
VPPMSVGFFKRALNSGAGAAPESLFFEQPDWHRTTSESSKKKRAEIDTRISSRQIGLNFRRLEKVLSLHPKPIDESPSAAISMAVETSRIESVVPTAIPGHDAPQTTPKSQ